MISKGERCSKCRGRKTQTRREELKEGRRQEGGRVGGRGEGKGATGVPLSLQMIADACVRREALELSASTGYPLNISQRHSDWTSTTPTPKHGTSVGDSTSTLLSFSNSVSSSPPLSGTKKMGEEVNEDPELIAERRLAREKALSRFHSKRATRSFSKTVRYECRKQVADRRPRVKGRFVGKELEGAQH